MKTIILSTFFVASFSSFSQSRYDNVVLTETATEISFSDDENCDCVELKAAIKDKKKQCRPLKASFRAECKAALKSLKMEYKACKNSGC